MIETKKAIQLKHLMNNEHWLQIFKDLNPSVISIKENVIHKLSHQTIHATFIEVEVKKSLTNSKEYVKVNKNNYHQYAIPKLIENYLSEQIH